MNSILNRFVKTYTLLESDNAENSENLLTPLKISRVYELYTLSKTFKELNDVEEFICENDDMKFYKDCILQFYIDSSFDFN